MAGGSYSVALTDTQLPQVARFTANIAQAAATYDLATVSSGAILILNSSIYVATAGATLTSVSIQTNQANLTSVMTAAEGAVANLLAQKSVIILNHSLPIYMASGQKMQFTIVGLTGTGSLLVTFLYVPVDSGARLS